MSTRQEQWEEGWIRWRPGREKELAYSDVAKAVEEFEPVPHKAGRAAANWLKTEAIQDYPATVTWLNYENGRVEGFFAIRSGSFRLKETGGKRLRRNANLLKPASHIIWMCKHADAKIRGDRLISRATGVAFDVTQYQGNIALVINPFDNETAQMLTDKYAFLQCDPQSGQLWLPVLPAYPT